ncbi:MAG: PhzF family phenazine biosynthesis isomerase, partial [Coriobacteriia bacterium]|nr:PhzF family phenazine biosynthesis isomerase [Coriobacteriia bacterium]
MKQYIVDAFTSEPFSGNPAAVCVMESWPSEDSMMKLARENNLSETAFLVKETEGYRLRWFTPGTEVELCGHATLASSFVVLNYFEPGSDIVRFNTLSGTLTVTRRGNLYEMDFPTYELKEIPVTEAMERAFGVRPTKAVLGLDLVCVFDAEEQV